MDAIADARAVCTREYGSAPDVGPGEGGGGTEGMRGRGHKGMGGSTEGPEGLVFFRMGLSTRCTIPTSPYLCPLSLLCPPACFT